MQMLLQSLVSTPQKIGSEAGNSKLAQQNGQSGELTFDQLLGKALGKNASPITGETEAEISLEEWLSAAIHKGRNLLSQLPEESSGLLQEDSFTWSADMLKRFDKLPEPLQEAMTELHGLSNEGFISLMKEWLLVTEENGDHSLEGMVSGSKADDLTKVLGSNPNQAFASILALMQWSGDVLQQQNNNGAALSTKGAKDSLLPLLKEVQQVAERSPLLNTGSSHKNLEKVVTDVERLLYSQSPIGKNIQAKQQTLTENKAQYLQQLLTRQGQPADTGKAASTQVSTADTQGTMSKVQQMVFHLGDKKSEHAQSQQFIKQFHDMLGKSNLQSFRNGTQQLSIKLYPEHLGRLDVKLIQQNGQIQAQLLTTTKMAKDMVETQIHQLRQTFQQQNIAVERIIVEEQPSYLQQESEEQQSHKEDAHKDDNDSSRDRKEEDGSFADILDEITFNERA